MYIRRLEQRYTEEQKEKRDEIDTATTMVVNNIIFCYDGEKYPGNDNQRKKHK